MKLEIRLEAIGGQGAHSAGKILAEAAVLGMGYSGHHFSSFGSEKRGSPVKSYVRFFRDGRPVRSSAPVTHPDILVIFHEALLDHHPDCLDGSSDETVVLINTPQPPGALRFPEGFRARSIATVPALEIASALGCGLNSVLLGAFGNLCPEIPAEKLQETLSHFFSKLPPQLKEANQRGFERGGKKLNIQPFKLASATLDSSTEPRHGRLPRLGWYNAPIGGWIVNPGNSVLKDLSASRRGAIPEFKPDLCIQCGFCDMVCPDYCFVWKEDPAVMPIPFLQGIDYQYCKGCQKCIVACPMGALIPARDNENFTREQRVVKYPQAAQHPAHSQGPQNWQTLVAEMQPEAAMLTIQTEQALNPSTYLKPDFTQVPWPEGVPNPFKKGSDNHDNDDDDDDKS